MSGALVPVDLGPGTVAVGYGEWVLERAAEVDDPALLWNGATTLAGLAQKWNGHGQEKREIKAAQMYVEIELGQRLGPNPGAGPAKDNQPKNIIAYDNLDIPQPRVSELQRFHGHRELLVEAVRNGAVSRRSLLLAIDRATATPAEDVDTDGLDVREGDFRDVLGDIEPGTVALVLTDPPYPAQYLPLWSDLGKFAALNLVEGGSLVSYCGQSILPQALGRLGEHLRYWWTIALVHGQTQMIPGKFVSAGWKPLLWFVRDHRRDKAMLSDHVKGGTPRKTMPTGDDGSWAQSIEPLEPIISALTAPGDLIVDPFSGSGTVGIAATRFGRRFVGAEIGDPA